MRTWKHKHLRRAIQRRRIKRCRFTLKTAGGPMRCIFQSGHPPHGHTSTSDLAAPAVMSAWSDWLR